MPRPQALDPYLIDVLMRDLTGHDRQPSAFLVYLLLWYRTFGSGARSVSVSHRSIAEATGLSKSAVQAALRTLMRRRLVQQARASITATPEYTVFRPWATRAVRRRVASAVLLAVVCLAGARSARAQDPVLEPIPKPPMTRFVADARGTLASLKQDVTLASDLDVDSLQLPTRGLGFVVGAHFYPLRGKSIALGVGGEWLRARGSNTIEAEVEDGEDGPTVKTRWSHLSPQVSLNFGGRDGWSYVTVGLGRSKITTERDDAPQPDPESAVRTLNYGGGARWFMKKRVAFTVDLRFYSIDAQAATAGRIATPKQRLRVFSAGISVR